MWIVSLYHSAASALDILRWRIRDAGEAVYYHHRWQVLVVLLVAIPVTWAISRWVTLARERERLRREEYARLRRELRASTRHEAEQAAAIVLKDAELAQAAAVIDRMRAVVEPTRCWGAG